MVTAVSNAETEVYVGFNKNIKPYLCIGTGDKMAEKLNKKSRPLFKEFSSRTFKQHKSKDVSDALTHS